LFARETQKTPARGPGFLANLNVTEAMVCLRDAQQCLGPLWAQLREAPFTEISSSPL